MESVKEYYGKILNKSSDLKTNACCTLIKYPQYITDALCNIHQDVLSSYYGCGLVIPALSARQNSFRFGLWNRKRRVYAFSICR